MCVCLYVYKFSEARAVQAKENFRPLKVDLYVCTFIHSYVCMYVCTYK